jgi:Bacterial regulatory proteins, gntR family
MRELGMTTAELARRTGLSETTIRGIGRARKTNRAVLVAVSAGLGWRYDYLANIACGQPEKNVRDAPPADGNVKRMLQAEVAPLREQARILREELADLNRKLDAKNAHDSGGQDRAMEPATSVPLPDDMDADYSPQYVRLARKLRADIESGVLRRRDRIRAAGLSERYGVSEPVARAALSMLAANHYVHRPDRFHAYKVTDEWASGPAGG